MHDTKTCRECGEVKPLSSFARNGGCETRRSKCRACYKREGRRRAGVPPREEWVAMKAASRAVKLRQAPRCSIVARHPDRAFALRYRNALYRAKYERSGDAERTRTQAYKHGNPGRVAQWGQRRWEQAAAQADGSLTPSVVHGLLAHATECAYCERALTPRTRTLDHVQPLSRGGAHSVTNVVVACRSCNLRKSALTLGEWLDRLDEQRRTRCA